MTEQVEWPEGLVGDTTERRLSEVYDLVRNCLDGTSDDLDDLRAYEALDFLYRLARNALGLPAWYLPRWHREVYDQLTPDERALLLAAKSRGGEILDNPDWAPARGTLVERGLVGKYEVALTPAGRDLAKWMTFLGLS